MSWIYLLVSLVKVEIDLSIDRSLFFLVLIGFILIALLGISYPLMAVYKTWKKRSSRRPMEHGTQNSVPFLTHA